MGVPVLCIPMHNGMDHPVGNRQIPKLVLQDADSVCLVEMESLPMVSRDSKPFGLLMLCRMITHAQR